MAKFQIVAVSTSTGDRTIMTAEPVTRAEAETILSKMTQHKCRTLVIEELPEDDPVAAIRAQAKQDMIDAAARWRAMPGKDAKRIVFVDAENRLLWLVDGLGYVGMQMSSHCRRPLVMESSGITLPQLHSAILAFDLCQGEHLKTFRPVEFGHYCELAAKGCEVVIQMIEEAAA